jgi:hypothetical protein
LSGRKALITGGDSGMGRAAAIAYAREGADVVTNYLLDEEPDAREVVDLIRKAGRKAVPIPGDLRTAAFCRELVSKAISGLGGLDIVVCNAGRQQSIPSILDVTDDEFDRTMKTNIYAPFWIIRAALPHLESGSVIIGTTSEQAYDPSPDLYAYAQTNGIWTDARVRPGRGKFRSIRDSRSGDCVHPKHQLGSPCLRRADASRSSAAHQSSHRRSHAVGSEAAENGDERGSSAVAGGTAKRQRK